MQNWLISANKNIYNYSEAFEKWGYIDWRQSRKYSVGDTVFIYCTKPIQKIVYKTTVEKEGMTFSEITDDKEFWIDEKEYYKSQEGTYVRLRLIDEVNSESLSLKTLVDKHLLTVAPQGPIKMSSELSDYVNSIMLNDYSTSLFPNEDVTKTFKEGTVKTVLVNKYERNPVARQKCIEFYGNEYKCVICGINFEKVYGDIGKGFIHVHHLIPLNEIGEEYIIDPKKDLIPVCPNCHAMLHRKIDGHYMSVERLMKVIEFNRINHED